MEDCIFCSIINGDLPASFVYRDDAALAFMDISTLNTGQVVVIPRVHVPYLDGLDEADGDALFRTTTRVCRAIRQSGIPCDGINLFLADGEAAGQEVFHVHFLVIPRLRGDTMKVNGTWVNPPRQELDSLAARLRDTYARLFPA